jgi:hypothetical protein
MLDIKRKKAPSKKKPILLWGPLTTKCLKPQQYRLESCIFLVLYSKYFFILLLECWVIIGHSKRIPHWYPPWSHIYRRIWLQIPGGVKWSVRICVITLNEFEWLMTLKNKVTYKIIRKMLDIKRKKAPRKKKPILLWGPLTTKCLKPQQYRLESSKRIPHWYPPWSHIYRRIWLQIPWGVKWSVRICVITFTDDWFVFVIIYLLFNITSSKRYCLKCHHRPQMTYSHQLIKCDTCRIIA